jgi:outer membrane immunogenic protein
MADVVARLNALEKRNSQLAEENAALKQRVSRLESTHSPAVAQVEPATKAPNSSQTTVTTSAVVPTSARLETGSIERASQPEPAFSWTGAYVGVHGGGGWGDLSFSDSIPTVPFVVETFRDDLDASGVVGGVQLGANRQFGNLVVGGELSVSGASISGSNSACFADAMLGLVSECKARVNWLVTGLARLGYAHDRWLVSGAAGWSVAGAEYDAVFDVGVPVPSGSSETLSGFTYGAGFNYALTRSVSLGVEYLHADLSADGHAFLGDLFGAGKGERDLDLNIGRAQLNVKLGE